MQFSSSTSFSVSISRIQDIPQDESLFYVTIYLDAFLICHTSEEPKDAGFSVSAFHTIQQKYLLLIESTPTSNAVVTPVTDSETFHKKPMFRKVPAFFQALVSPLQSLCGG